MLKMPAAERECDRQTHEERAGSKTKERLLEVEPPAASRTPPVDPREKPVRPAPSEISLYVVERVVARVMTTTNPPMKNATSR